MEKEMVPWTVIYKIRQKGEIMARVMIAPVDAAAAWPHCQNLSAEGTILAMVRGSHEAITGYMPAGQEDVKVTERELLTPNDPKGW
jgi:hypothetical protein